MRFGWGTGRLAAAVTVGVVTVVVSWLASVDGEYVAVPVADALVHALPTALLTWVIAAVGEHATLLFALSAAGVTAALFATLVFVSVALLTRIGPDAEHIAALSAVVVVTTLSVMLAGGVRHAIGLGLVGGSVVWLFGRFDRDSTEPGGWSRRDVVALLGGGLFGGFGALLSSSGPDLETPVVSLPDRTRREIETLRDDARSRELDVPGLPGLLTPIGEFYVVDINIEPPAVDADSWSVAIGGAVETDVTLTRDRLELFEPVSELLTLRCIGEELNGTLMSSAIWTGVAVTALLERAGPEGEYAKLVGADGYSEVVPVSMLEDALLVYAMNGRPLPREHGFPARILVPGSWGKVNVKWITDIEIRTEATDGFWSEWEGTSAVNTIAKLWRAHPTEDGMVVAGHAYAGSRGIEAVEVSTDGGETWGEATLSDPLSDPATWRQWRYEWQPDPTRDSAEVVVRAVDGEGRLQTEAHSDPKPDGATGWVSRRIETTEATDFSRGYRE